MHRSRGIRICLLLCLPLLVIFLCSCTNHDQIIDQVIIKEAQAHMEQVYPHDDFVIDKAYYAFKDNCYRVEISSPSSQDSYFYLEYHLTTHELLRDTYQNQVLSGQNTADRLEQDYSTCIRAALQNTDGLLNVAAKLCTYSENKSVDQFFSPHGLKKETLILDHSYNMEDIGREYGYIEISVREEEHSVDKFLEQLLQIHAQLSKANAEYYVISLSLEAAPTAEETKSFNIYGITQEDLLCGDPLTRLQQMWTEQEAHRQALKAEWEKSS